MKENVMNLLEYLYNGIEINGTIREFDIVDYYQNINIDRTELINYAENMLKSNLIELKDIVQIKTFFAKNELKERMTTYDIKMLFEEVNEFNTKFDERGNSIRGSGRIINLEEKKFIFDYIVNNNLPLNRKIYTLLLRRIVSGEITVEKQMKV